MGSSSKKPLAYHIPTSTSRSTTASIQAGRDYVNNNHSPEAEAIRSNTLAGGCKGGCTGGLPEITPPPPPPDTDIETGMKPGQGFKTLGDIGKNAFDREATGLEGLTTGGTRRLTTPDVPTKRKKTSDLVGVNVGGLADILSKGVTV